LATVLSEECNEPIHRIEAGRVDHRTAIAAYRDKTGKAEPVEMEREGIRSETKFFGDLTGRHAFWSDLDQQAEDFQPIFLGERGQCRYRI
jgi:hypothetical protein